MRLLVLGGSVFLSRAAAAAALERGHEVTCANRGLTGSIPEGARFLRFDRADPVPAELTAFDAVIDVARHPSRVQRAVAALPEAHWVFVSRISAYADEATPGQRANAATLEPRYDDVDLSQDPTASCCIDLQGMRKLFAGETEIVLRIMEAIEPFEQGSQRMHDNESKFRRV